MTVPGLSWEFLYQQDAVFLVNRGLAFHRGEVARQATSQHDWPWLTISKPDNF